MESSNKGKKNYKDEKIKSNCQNPLAENDNQNIIMNEKISNTQNNDMNKFGMMNFANANNFKNMNMMDFMNCFNMMSQNQDFIMNNSNFNQKNIMNNLTTYNIGQTSSNNNINPNNFNENILINDFIGPGLNDSNISIYTENSNSKISEDSKLILEDNNIRRIDLISSIGVISPTFECKICCDLVMNPVECENCSKLFCQNCINNWLKNSNKCPNKHQFAKKQELDDWIKKEISKIFIKCPYIGCNSNYAYKHWTRHVKKCICKNNGIQKLNFDESIESNDNSFKYEIVQFFVKDIYNKTHTFRLALSTTVKELKLFLEEKTGLKVESQRLSCNGKTMDDGKMLEFYRLQNGQVIFQLSRLLGGNRNIKDSIRLNN